MVFTDRARALGFKAPYRVLFYRVYMGYFVDIHQALIAAGKAFRRRERVQRAFDGCFCRLGASVWLLKPGSCGKVL